MPIEPWLRRAAALRPDSVAVSLPDGALTYAELAERAAGVAGALADAGIEPGDRVAVRAVPALDFAVALHGCLLAGAAVVPLDPRHTDAELAARTGAARATLDPAAGLPSARALPRPAAWAEDAPALVVHTSGTTGAPKPVVLSHGNLVHSALASAAALGLDPREHWVSPLPVAHVGGLMVLIRSAIYATRAALLPAPFDAQALSEALREATVASLVPTMLARLLEHSVHAPRLRVVLLGGAPAPRALLERAAAAGLPVAPTYGLTEACSQVTVAAPGDLDTSGMPLPGTAVTVAADGELLVEGPTVAGGGVLRTGDLGYRDERGRLVVAGRRDDLIVSGGENVMPAEVEDVLLTHPAVADVAVLGVPDPEWGQQVVARVVPATGAEVEPDELRALCRRRLAAYKVPKAFEPVASLPRTPSGKLIRGALRAPEPPAG